MVRSVVYIRRSDVEQHGYIPGCEGCTALRFERPPHKGTPIHGDTLRRTGALEVPRTLVRERGRSAHAGIAPDTTGMSAGSSTDPLAADARMVPATASSARGGVGPGEASIAFAQEEEARQAKSSEAQRMPSYIVQLRHHRVAACARVGAEARGMSPRGSRAHRLTAIADCLCQSLLVFVSLSAFLSLCLSICVSVCLSACVFVRYSLGCRACLSVWPSQQVARCLVIRQFAQSVCSSGTPGAPVIKRGCGHTAACLLRAGALNKMGSRGESAHFAHDMAPTVLNTHFRV